jgi:NADH-quinone oxidoreductase subunit E
MVKLMSDSTINHKLYIKENKSVSFSAETLEKIRLLVKRYPEGMQKSALLPVLHIAQEELGGYLSVDVMDYVAALLDLQPIEVYEVATFYSMFFLDKVGKYVLEVCQTGPCAICGGEEIIEYLKKKLDINIGETTADGIFTLRAVECLGACGYAPVMQVNTGFYEFLTPGKIDTLLEDLRTKVNEEEPLSSRWAGKFF